MMAIPLAGARMKQLLSIYRDARRAAGHPGEGRAMLAFHMFCAPTRERAFEVARAPLDQYIQSIVRAAADWASGMSSKDYPNYQRMFAAIAEETFDSAVAKGSAWVGTPDDIRAAIETYARDSGGFEVASLQVNFGTVPVEEAEASMRLFARDVMPAFPK